MTDNLVTRLKKFECRCELVEDNTKCDSCLAADEIGRLRQGLWDCAIIAGEDTDGNKTPDHLIFPDIVEFAKQAVQGLRNDYNECLDESII